MLRWIIAASFTATCYGLSVIETGFSVALLAGMMGLSLAEGRKHRLEVRDELDRIRTTQLLEIYDGGAEDESN